jgi:hypothetical protein
LTLPVSFQCCFCEKGIASSEERAAVVLTATSLTKWKAGAAEVGQSFYAHAACLVENVKLSYPWEIEAILEDNDD